MNELNWERFRSELRAEGAAIRAEADKRFSAIDARLLSIEGRFPAFEERLDAKFDARVAQIEARMFKRMFGFWTATIIPLGALILALNGAFQR